ncbi:SDR family NAD(P)-dependent oxidoreductase [Leisingera sp. JC1]|uniref:SDR family NAD(P)-dependent oxidoreductase n=1 Tax=Leisingera sp. JC1 TaxID=1855282 RepID=UPI000802B053|nr:SDR family NAD(P)-dependent oxidoreductase [Leisingera sp. JC1]OBY25149.1 oxidoreductase [Leisingera sp. JC1]
MTKTILITGSTDGIGLQTARSLVGEGQRVLLHGRSADKLATAKAETGAETGFIADLSSIAGANALAEAVRREIGQLDVLINNAGVFKTPQAVTEEGYDIRFMVNTIAPYALTKALVPAMPATGRVVNLSSAAQAPFSLEALRGEQRLAAQEAYSQSKLALTGWTRALAAAAPNGPVFLAINPGSLLATKMVQEGYGIAGNDIAIGAAILRDAALDPAFADKSGAYFDNDSGCFADPHPFVMQSATNRALVEALDTLAAQG